MPPQPKTASILPTAFSTAKEPDMRDEKENDMEERTK
jgi:hypothetical protein